MDEYDEPIEAYCVRCRETVEVEQPQAVWTRKGMPATRGECSMCGGTVFRMGKTDAHRESQRPDAVEVLDGAPSKRPKLERDTVYVIYAPSDSDSAERLAQRLTEIGIATWLHEHEDNVAWAGGVHPAMDECNKMIYVLSEAALMDETVIGAWQYFREKRKPIVIAQLESVAPPDDIRRSPRFDLSTEDDKRAFRQMVQALSA